MASASDEHPRRVAVLVHLLHRLSKRLYPYTNVGASRSSESGMSWPRMLSCSATHYNQAFSGCASCRTPLTFLLRIYFSRLNMYPEMYPCLWIHREVTFW